MSNTPSLPGRRSFIRENKTGQRLHQVLSNQKIFFLFFFYHSQWSNVLDWGCLDLRPWQTLWIFPSPASRLKRMSNRMITCTLLDACSDGGMVGLTVWLQRVENLQERRLRRRSQNTEFQRRREACPGRPRHWLWWWPWRSTPAASPSTSRLRPEETRQHKTRVTPPVILWTSTEVGSSVFRFATKIKCMAHIDTHSSAISIGF